MSSSNLKFLHHLTPEQLTRLSLLVNVPLATLPSYLASPNQMNRFLVRQV